MKDSQERRSDKEGNSLEAVPQHFLGRTGRNETEQDQEAVQTLTVFELSGSP